MPNRKWNKLTSTLLAAAVIGVCCSLSFSVHQTYDTYTRTIASQMQDHLMVSARSVSQNLSLYLSEQMTDINILCRTPGFMTQFRSYYADQDINGLKEYILSYMLTQESDVARIYLLDEDGNEIYRYNSYPFLESFEESRVHLDELTSRKQSGIGNVIRVSSTQYALTLVNTVMDGNDQIGSVVCLLDLDKVYEDYIQPLESEGDIQIIVKNDKGTVIMHPEKKMIQFNPLRDIENLDTLPQYAGMYEMLQREYSQEEGTAIYKAYSNDILPAREEICAFSRMNLSGTSWYVSAVMPYSDVTHTVNTNLNHFALLLTLVMVLIAASLFIIYSLIKNREKLQMEASWLRNLNHTLEELQESREEVRHYQKIQTIGSLTSEISHEFNNLLTPILGLSEFVRNRLGPESEYYEDLDEIHEAGARAKEIIQQILHFSRRENGPSTFTVVSLDGVLFDSLKMISMLLPSSVTLRKEILDEKMNVFGSATQIHQVVLNLCSNALQAMEKTGGTLTVMMKKVQRNELPENYQPARKGEFPMISVQDTGCGIPPEILPHIFDPFFTTKEDGEGTGLGLSVVKDILISHGGCITADSTPEKGSCFTFYLPLIDADAAADEQLYHAENSAYEKK